MLVAASETSTVLVGPAASEIQVKQDVSKAGDSAKSCEHAVQFTHQAVLTRKHTGSPQQAYPGSLQRRHRG